jgi:hypothetical protein
LHYCAARFNEKGVFAGVGWRCSKDMTPKNILHIEKSRRNKKVEIGEKMSVYSAP